MKFDIKAIFRENRIFLIFLVLMFTFRSTMADWNSVPTGSMKPTILEGDRILVNKMAYDIHLPFTNISLMKLADPRRGDIVVFDSEKKDMRLVKRVIGIPGDVVELRHNVLYINGTKLAYQETDDDVSATPEIIDKLEDLPGKKHSVRLHKYGSLLDSFPPVRVPQDHYLMMGDNRDNSADSRVFGFVPRGEIVGRSNTVVMSLNYDNYYLPRTDRFLHDL